MKHFFQILLFLTSTALCQSKLSIDQVNILTLELNDMRDKYPHNNSLKKIIGDSLLVNKCINHYDIIPSGYGLKEWSVGVQELTVDEANEIFGNGELNYSAPDKNKAIWLADDFTGYKIAFVDDRNMGPRDNILVRFHNVFSLSIPSVRSDGRFAFIHVANADGGQLKIYKKIDEKWILYKSMWLYLI
jgi:hypothetical protein